MERPTKAMIIGWDAPIIKSVKKYIQEGKMPNLERLISNGVWAENCLVPHPTITPPNWTTIATGSWPGTHGITCFSMHKPGTPLNKTYQAFFSTDCQAEYIWQTIEKAGKRTIVFNYPSSWPKSFQAGIQVAGAGLSVNEWRTDIRSGGTYDVTLSADMLFTTEEIPEATTISVEQASAWQGVELSSEDKESRIVFTPRMAREKMQPEQFYLLIEPARGRVSLARGKKAGEILVRVPVGRWSEKVTYEFQTETGKKKAVFICRLLSLSKDGSNLKFYVSPLCQLDGWADPPEICGELAGVSGLPLPNSFVFPFHYGWFDVDILSDLYDMQNLWFAEAAYHLLTHHDWDLFIMHAHCPDHAYHAYINRLEPSVTKDENVRKKFEEAERRFYSSLDAMLGRILQAADEKTLVIITSDHGAVPTEGAGEEDFHGFSVAEILIQAGLTVMKKDSQTGKEVVDWEKTKAVAQRSVYIYINLKGRDPQGIVQPGAEYEKLREEIISLLYNYTDPRTGRKPVAFALKKEDARILGLYGDYIGDIVYGVGGWVSGEHGRQLTTAEYGIGSLKGLFIMKGPGVKKGYVLNRNVWLVDIVPTICYLLNWPVPKDAEGAVLYQAFQDHDFQRKELEKWQQHYKKVKQALEGEKALTHDYSL